MPDRIAVGLWEIPDYHSVAGCVGDSFRGDGIRASVKKLAHGMKGALNTLHSSGFESCSCSDSQLGQCGREHLLCAETCGQVAQSQGPCRRGKGYSPAPAVWMGRPAQPLNLGFCACVL